LHDRSESLFRDLRKDDPAQEHDPKTAETSFPIRIVCKSTASSSNSAAGRDGQVPVTSGRMDAIRNIKTMAGSPDADLLLRSASRNLAHGFCVFGGALAFREPMKEDHYV
jgi:hypothetical protein